MKPRIVTLFLLEQVLSVFVMAAALFLSAGRVDWPAAWAAIAVWLGWFAAMDIILLRTNPELIGERLSPPKGAKSWDRAILSVLRLAELGRYILAGLDQRFGWTVGFPPVAQFAGLMVCTCAAARCLCGRWLRTHSSRRSSGCRASAAMRSRRRARTATCATRVTPEWRCSRWHLDPARLLAGDRGWRVLRDSADPADRARGPDAEEGAGRVSASMRDRVRYRLVPGIW